jgi:hypothetical protein
MGTKLPSELAVVELPPLAAPTYMTYALKLGNPGHKGPQTLRWSSPILAHVWESGLHSEKKKLWSLHFFAIFLTL